jgi:hypothetical protein
VSRTGWRLSEVPWHPPVLAATVVLSYWLDVVVSPHAAFRSLVVAVAGAAVLTLILWALLRSPQRAGIAATALIGLLFSKHLVDVVSDLSARAPAAIFIVWALLILLVAVLAVRLVIRTRARWSARRLNEILNRAALLLFASTIGFGIVSGRLPYGAGDLEHGVPLDEAPSAATEVAAEGVLPDIYLLLLDGYPRADVLAHAFDIDNSAFLDALAERGFEVATDSHSDYLWTRQSLTSMLHMAYVDQIAAFQAVVAGRAPEHPTLRELIVQNPAFDLARESGYQVVATGYEFEEEALRQADVYVDGGHLNEFEFKLMVSTFLGDVLAVVTPDLASGQHRERIEYQLASLGRIAAAGHEQPRLVMGHIPAPHQPAVFGANGEPVVVPISRLFYADSPEERGEPMEEFKQRYRDQLEYLNRRFLETVDAIQDSSAELPVIILWADHGSATRANWVIQPWQTADPDVVLERTGTLFAASTPGRSDVFPNDISPASIFRYLADAYLDTDLGRAEPPADGLHIPPVDASVLAGG